MFGFGSKKKKYLEELAEVLSELANINLTESRNFIKMYESWVLSETLDRKLDPFLGIWNISEKSLERIAIAHRLKKYEEANVVPHYMLLVSLKANGAIKKMAEQTETPYEPSSYLDQVISLPVNVENSDVTYAHVLKGLVEKNSQDNSQG